VQQKVSLAEAILELIELLEGVASELHKERSTTTLSQAAGFRECNNFVVFLYWLPQQEAF
jgi:hypothetical protein